MKSRHDVLMEVAFGIESFQKDLAAALREQDDDGNWDGACYASCKASAQSLIDELSKLTNDREYRYSLIAEKSLAPKKPIAERAQDLRYIVFLIDSKHKEHDGRVYSSYDDARESAIRSIEERYCDKAVVGMFLLDQLAEDMTITKVESFGFTGDKKRIEQLDLFRT